MNGRLNWFKVGSFKQDQQHQKQPTISITSFNYSPRSSKCFVLKISTEIGPYIIYIICGTTYMLGGTTASIPGRPPWLCGIAAPIIPAATGLDPKHRYHLRFFQFVLLKL